jgi:hypothetical protein
MQATVDAPLPIIAQVAASQESFVGHLDGETLVMSSSRGAVCSGRVRIGSLGYGHGNFVCKDGRAGNFSVHVSGRFGSAYGTFDGRRITLTLG